MVILQLHRDFIKDFILNNRYIAQTPHIKQMEFLLNFKTEVLYGGAAGGAKSSALLMAALMFVDVKDYNAILFRKTYADLALPGALISRSHEWLDCTDARWDQTTHKWTFPAGSTLSFGYLDSENSRYRYQGAEFQFIGIDELTQHQEVDYTYLFSRLRKSERSKVPLRMRSASNPGGVGHDWVYDRFFVQQHQDREFISSKLSDNPSINQTEYIKSLENLDPVTREQLLNGNWVITAEGNLFKREWFKDKIIDENDVPKGGVTVRFWDLAATVPKKGRDPDFTAGVKVKLYKGQYYILDVVHVRVAPGEVEDIIKRTTETDGKSTVVMIEEEPGASSKIVMNDIARRVLVGYPFLPIRVTDSKMKFARIFSAACYNKNVNIVRAAWNSDFITECVAFPNKDIHDDQVDAASKAISQLPVIPAIFSVDSDDEISFGKAVTVGKDYSKDWDDLLSHDDVKFESVIDIL